MKQFSHRHGVLFAVAFAFLFTMTLPSLSVHATATITVNTTQDSVDAGGCATPASVCSLRDAVQYAAQIANVTIAVPPGTYRLTRTCQTFAHPCGALTVSSSSPYSNVVTILGSGATIDGGAIDSAFVVQTTAQFSGITVTGGRNLDDSSRGGGITIYPGGVLTLTNCVIRNNTAMFGGGIHSEGGLTLQNTAVNNNTSQGAGGGIFFAGTSYGPLVVQNSTITGNVAGYGTGVSSHGGGGIEVAGSNTVTITGSTISGNQAYAEGGGISAYLPFTMTNDTVSGNTAGSLGGGIYTEKTATLTNVTVASNAPSGLATANQGTLLLFDTLLANAYPSADCTAGASVASQDYNLSGDGSCNLTGAHDQRYTNAQPGPLANNGGPTLTQAITATSPATDHGGSVGCPTTDQRGLPRPSGRGCDIGAYEYQVVPNTAPSQHTPGSVQPGHPGSSPVTHASGGITGVPNTQPGRH